MTSITAKYLSSTYITAYLVPHRLFSSLEDTSELTKQPRARPRYFGMYHLGYLQLIIDTSVSRHASI